jgi:hypothetical protein
LRVSYGAYIEDVSVRVSGVGTNIGVSLSGDFTEIGAMNQVDVQVTGGSENYGVNYEASHFGGPMIRDSSVVVQGATNQNYGIYHNNDFSGNGLWVADTTVIVNGGRRTFGIIEASEETGDARITGGLVSASDGTEGNTAILVADFVTSLDLRGTKILSSGVGIFAGLQEAVFESIIEDASIDADVGILMGGYPGTPSFPLPEHMLTVKDTKIRARQAAIRTNSAQERGNVYLLRCLLAGEKSIDAATLRDRGSVAFEVEASALTGTTTLGAGATITCSSVTDGLGQYFSDSCPNVVN